MRCQECDYELWHCTGRTCPECGAGFSLEFFEFEHEKVLFHCPHCDFGIAGEKPFGRPSKNIQQCTSCGLAVGDELYVVRPIDEANATSFGSLLPFRQTSGNWFTRYFSTVRLVMTNPQIAISRVPIQEPLWIAWKFFITTSLFVIVAGLIPLGIFFLISLASKSPNILSGFELILIFDIQFILTIIFTGMYIVFWSLITHVLMQVTGGSCFTLRRTMQTVLYGGGASITGIIPCFGSPISFVWWIVATTNMVARGQRLRGGRATFVTITGPLLIFTFVCGGYLMLMAAVVAPAVTRTQTATQQAQQQMQQQKSLPAEPISE